MITREEETDRVTKELKLQKTSARIGEGPMGNIALVQEKNETKIQFQISN